MKLFPSFCLFLLALAGSSVGAQEYGRVISSQAVVQQVAVPRQVCNDQLMEIQGPKSGAGAVLGAVAGGAIGNAAGHGSGSAAATVLGAIGGAVLGDRIESAPPPQIQNVRSCSYQTVFENRTVAYNIVYEYAGKQYSTQMAQDPGPTVPVQVSPLGSSNVAPSSATASVVSPVYTAPQVVETRIIYQPAYAWHHAARPLALPPVQLNFDWVEGPGRHRHWR
jgi:uncharacterized protein YcfJ